MATKVHMEALSPTMEEGQLVRWLKAEGDPVSNGEVLAEIETDKATMELVARGEGVLRKILLKEGGTAPVGEIIAIIAGEDEDIEDLGTEVGAGTGAAEGVQEEVVAEGRDGAPEVKESEDIAESADEEEAEKPEDEQRVKASPVARRLAEEARLDLRKVAGSGPGGRVVKRDVEAAKTGGAAVEGPSTEGRKETLEAQDFQDHSLSQMRKTIAKRLVESISPIPHFFLRITVDVSRILEARRRLNEWLEAEGDKISINDFILRATAGALERHPEVNAEWRGDAIRRHLRVHLGVAVAVEDGLITPVIRDANKKGLVEISREVRELASRGREKKLQPEEYTGSTFSVSNLGMYDIHEFTGVINPPEAGILAVGGVDETPVAVGGEVVVKPLMKVTMSCDHRVIDGATGSRFLQTLKEMLEEPAAILL